jgi:endonuclease YncB( thermonuclease family)
MFTYEAQLDRVVDGDTVVLDVDLGFHIHTIMHVRVMGVDCPELSTSRGKVAKTFTENWFQERAGRCVVRTSPAQPKSFDRWVGEIMSVDGARFLSLELISAGHVK